MAKSKNDGPNTVEVTDPVVAQAQTIEIDPTSSRWHVRAHRISECVEVLSVVWRAAAARACERQL